MGRFNLGREDGVRRRGDPRDKFLENGDQHAGFDSSKSSTKVGHGRKLSSIVVVIVDVIVGRHDGR
jgi:hypothetical protein